jgi:UDP-glucose 4-epimerase
LLGAGAFSDIRDLVELDMLAQSFFWKHPRTETVILRPTHILGSVRNAPSNYLRLKVVPTLMGFDPMVQAVHQEDLVRAIKLALRPGVRGIFNIAGPPPLPLSQTLSVLGRSSVPVPHTLAKLSVERLWKFRMTSFPAPELDFIRYVCMVDDSRARQVLGYKPSFGITETLRAVDEEHWV